LLRSYFKNTFGCNCVILVICAKKFICLPILGKHQNLFDPTASKFPNFASKLFFKTTSLLNFQGVATKETLTPSTTQHSKVNSMA